MLGARKNMGHGPKKVVGRRERKEEEADCSSKAGKKLRKTRERTCVGARQSSRNLSAVVRCSD